VNPAVRERKPEGTRHAHSQECLYHNSIRDVTQLILEANNAGETPEQHESLGAEGLDDVDAGGAGRRKHRGDDRSGQKH